MQESSLKTNFLGRDGFRWWIGQVAPIKAQGAQINGGGWGNRHKVRIMGYHPFDNELPDNDLPWAQCLLPTTAGTGAGNYATNTKIQQGDIVFGFFLDTDNAQTPVIVGCFGRTSQVLTGDYAGPFKPFTGYTERVKKPDGTPGIGVLIPDQSNESNANSQESPISAPTAVAAQVNKISYYGGIGEKTTFADTCNSSYVTNAITSEIDNLLNKVQNGANTFLKIGDEINKVTDRIQSLANGLVGKMFNFLYTKLESLLREGLDKLYKTTVAAAINPAIGHLAGVAAQTGMLGPVGKLQDAISCVANKVVEGLKGMIKELLNSLINNVMNFVTCAANQFIGSFLNKIIDDIVGGLGPAIDGVSKILSPAFKIADFLRSSVDSIRAIAGFFDCGQGNEKCSNLITEWKTGCGAKIPGLDQFSEILDTMNIEASSSLPVGNCYTGVPTKCNAPSVNIFGGGGSGAMGTAILGSFVNNTSGLSGVIDSVSTTASIIGVNITNPGSNYRFPPFVEFVDNCNKGYGAVGRSVINDKGQVTAIYLVSTGENYPVSQSQIISYTFGTIPTSINEGSTGTFNINTIGVLNGTTLYWTIDNVTTTGADFSATSGSFQINNNSGSFDITTLSDSLVEGDETFTVSIRTDSDIGTVVAISDSVAINDAIVPNPPPNNNPIPNNPYIGSTVNDVIVDDTGSNYSTGDIGIDTFGNTYTLIINNGQIIQAQPINKIEVDDLPVITVKSDTGSGAILRPILGRINPVPQGKIQFIRDCPD